MLKSISKMSENSETFSRNYLQDLPEMIRKQTIQQAINQITGRVASQVYTNARHGKKTYMYDPTNQQYGLNPNQPTVGNDDLVAAFQKKFPGCNVSFQETWIETRQGVKELKKGILIDWS